MEIIEKGQEITYKILEPKQFLKSKNLPNIYFKTLFKNFKPIYEKR